MPFGTQYFFNLYAQQKTIEFSITLEEENDQELKVLLTYISENIANRLLEQVDRDGTALWVKDLRFARDGLEYLYMYDWEPIPYNQIGECEIAGGIFHLRSTKSDLPVFRNNTIAPNFFPGLIALRKKCTPEPTPKLWRFPGENN